MMECLVDIRDIFIKRTNVFTVAFCAMFLLSSCSQPPADYTDNGRKVYKRSGTSVSSHKSSEKSTSYNYNKDNKSSGDERKRTEEDETHNMIFEEDNLHEEVDAVYNSEEFALPYPMGNYHFMWPLDGKVIAHYDKAAGREGINIVADINTSVKSAAAGKVIYVGDDLSEYGKLVIVKHDNEILTAYAHLNEASVRKGDIIQKGQRIAKVGHSGDVSAPQLHFSIRKRDFTINPEKQY